MQDLNAPYLVFVHSEEGWRAYLHVRSGQGRAARRRLVGVWAVNGPLTRRSLPDVLRQVAAAMEVPPSLRSGNVPQGPGAPQGRWGEQLRLDLPH